jgi:peptidoglycan/xylan/chitin deacetylase (PgdA/CDA1 family)
MSTVEVDPLLDVLVSDFGGNYVFALDLLEQYRGDRRSVETSWRDYFDHQLGVTPDPEPTPAPTWSPPVTVVMPEAQAQAQRPKTSLARADGPTTALARDKSRAVVVPAILPGDIAQPIRGGALRIVENMEASLHVPTATSVRNFPVRTLEENRRILNKHREATGKSKVSFTHIVAWAILRALDAFPRMNDAYAELEAGAHRIQRDQVRLGIAVDVQKKDGSRTLLVPNIKDANRLDFAAYVRAFDELVAKARKGTISPDDFQGTTISLTNPGTVGTSSSAPRLMPGQGAIVATGALDYPAEYRAMAPRTLSLLGVSKVMTVTSTYDHRIIQGAESGLFLARMEDLLKGQDAFFERIFDDLGLPHRPVRWEMDTAPGLGGSAGNREEVEKQARVLALIHNYRVRGHLVADLDPLDSKRAPHKDLDPATYGLTLWDLDREFITNGLSGKDKATLREILEVLKRHRIPASFFVPAVVALLHPDEQRRVIDEGHEIGMHGWIHEWTGELSEHVERDLMRRAYETLTKTTGKTPVGVRVPSWDFSPSTLKIIRELRLLYDSSLMADDEPYELLEDGQPTGVVELPVEWIKDDAPYFGMNRASGLRPYTAPSAVLEIFKAEFDGAVAERGLFLLTLHPHITGHRSRMWVLEALIEHMKRADGVWFATHEDVARYCKENAP